jgi:hypothetical protein
MSDRDELVALLRKLGAGNPEHWISENGGLAQNRASIARFLFLRQAWRRLQKIDDDSWIQHLLDVDEGSMKAPFREALQRVLASGVNQSDLTMLVALKQSEALFSICYVLEDANVSEPEVANMRWGLFVLNEDGSPGEPLSALYEDVYRSIPDV